jgi:hypothetical protein
MQPFKGGIQVFAGGLREHSGVTDELQIVLNQERKIHEEAHGSS